MESPLLLHMFTPGRHTSPFDVNMAYDAGWDAAIPYCGVELDEVADLVQDTIFSRGPGGARRTGIFFGGKDVYLAMDMVETARGAMVPPFEVSVMADPSGGFTTAAGLVALVESKLQSGHGTDLGGKDVAIFGGTGPVGVVSGVLAARAGARVTLISHQGKERADQEAERCNERFEVKLEGGDGSSEQAKQELVNAADVILCTAPAGVQVLTADQVKPAPKLKVVADVNAVPPAGVESVGVQDDGVSYPDSASGALAIGALAVGGLKYQAQHELLKRLHTTEKAEDLAFQDAFEVARGAAG